MAVTRTDTFDQRAAILGRLSTRNRVVSLLRVGVPAAGAVSFLLLVGQIYIANLAHQYGVSGIRIDRGNLVVETPQYAGVGKDGSQYVINASEARSPIGNSNVITMTDARLDLSRAGKSTFHATAAEATANTAANDVTVPGVTTVTSDDGMHGTLVEVHSDMGADLATARGPVDIAFSDGTTLNAANMVHDGSTQLWTFERATVVMQSLPAATADASSFETEEASQ